MYEYEAEIERIVDGDTVDVDIDLGLHVHVHERLRLKGIDTPEIFGVKKDSVEYQAGVEARDFLGKLIPPGTRVKVRTVRDRKGKYGRYVADVIVTDPDDGSVINVGELLVDRGHAEVSNG